MIYPLVYIFRDNFVRGRGLSASRKKAWIPAFAGMTPEQNVASGSFPQAFALKVRRETISRLSQQFGTKMDCRAMLAMTDLAVRHCEESSTWQSMPLPQHRSSAARRWIAALRSQ
jgi:hypothetical protein